MIVPADGYEYRSRRFARGGRVTSEGRGRARLAKAIKVAFASSSGRPSSASIAKWSRDSASP